MLDILKYISSGNLLWFVAFSVFIVTLTGTIGKCIIGIIKELKK